MRVGSSLTDESIKSNFGEELAYRLDYVDWQFPSWTLENLLKAVSGNSSRRKLQYDDDAALLLAQYCMKTGGGVRVFDNLEAAIIRHLRTTGKTNENKINVNVAQEILNKRGVSSSATVEA
jgi:hypothetical protein